MILFTAFPAHLTLSGAHGAKTITCVLAGYAIERLGLWMGLEVTTCYLHRFFEFSNLSDLTHCASLNLEGHNVIQTWQLSV